MKLNTFSESVARLMDEQGLSDIVGGSENTVAGCEEIGNTVLHLTLLEPDMKILDFGAGCGRLALPILQHLSDQGSYVGVDIIPRLVQFCNANIATKYANCEFYLSADRNKLYDKFINEQIPDCQVINSLSELGEGTFDVIASFSVFTHLSDTEAATYLHALKKLLKPNGRLLISCFLINQASRNYLRLGKSTIPFPDDVFESKDVYYLAHNGELTAVGYE